MQAVPPTSIVRVAPLWRRAISRAIDFAFLAALITGTLYVAHKLKLEYFPVNDALVFAVVIGYEVLLPAIANGASVGRLAARITPTKEDGQSRPSLLQYFARTATRLALFALFAIFVAYEIDLPSFLFVCLIEAIVCASRRNRQSLGDLVARTLLVQRPSRVATVT